MTAENLFYPEMSEQGKKELANYLDGFKEKLKSIISATVDEIYCHDLFYLESDCQTNFKNSLLSALCNYRSTESHAHDFKKIRQAIFEENKHLIIEDLNQDLIQEIKILNERIEWLGKMNAQRY